jgi:hypothetical protein
LLAVSRRARSAGRPAEDRIIDLAEFRQSGIGPKPAPGQVFADIGSVLEMVNLAEQMPGISNKVPIPPRRV